MSYKLKSEWRLLESSIDNYDRNRYCSTEITNRRNNESAEYIGRVIPCNA